MTVKHCCFWGGTELVCFLDLIAKIGMTISKLRSHSIPAGDREIGISTPPDVGHTYVTYGHSGKISRFHQHTF